MPDPSPELVEKVAKAICDQQLSEVNPLEEWPSADAREKWVRRLNSPMHFERCRGLARAAIKAMTEEER